jgi:hypothetical protein
MRTSLMLSMVAAVLGCGTKSWDGKSPLVCANNATITVTGCKVDLPGQVAIQVDNNCTLTLDHCTISADTAISGENNVTIHLIETVLVGKKVALSLSNNVNVDARGGRIEGGELAMSITNHVHIALTNTPVVGKVQRSNHSDVDGLPALAAEQAAEKVANQFGQDVCNLAFRCYGAKYLGTLAGRFTVDLDATGTVLATQFDGDAPEAARACLTSVGDKHLAGFTGPKGKLECAYSGTIGPSSTRMDRGWTFVPAP